MGGDGWMALFFAHPSFPFGYMPKGYCYPSLFEGAVPLGFLFFHRGNDQWKV